MNRDRRPVKRAGETKAEVQKSVGLRVAELRDARGWTVAELAGRLEVSDRYVQRVEAGGANLTIESLVKFARTLNVRVADLFSPPTKTDRPAGRPPGRREKAPRRRTSRG